MRAFFWGVFLTIVVILVGAYLVMKLGYINFAADQEAPTIERHLAMTASDASLDRRAPVIQNPLTPTEDTLVAGAKLYRDNCAVATAAPQIPLRTWATPSIPPPPNSCRIPPTCPTTKISILSGTVSAGPACPRGKLNSATRRSGSS